MGGANCRREIKPFDRTWLHLALRGLWSWHCPLYMTVPACVTWGPGSLCAPARGQTVALSHCYSCPRVATADLSFLFCQTRWPSCVFGRCSMNVASCPLSGSPTPCVCLSPHRGGAGSLGAVLGLVRRLGWSWALKRPHLVWVPTETQLLTLV